MNQLAEKIAAEVTTGGPISFARFMELALYCPVYGYYEKEEDKIGLRGDYYTSVSVGSLFGELLACQFAEWLGSWPLNRLPLPVGLPGSVKNECQNPNPQFPTPGQQARVTGTTSPLQIVEAGSHDGRLAHDILGWFKKARPDLFERLEYWILEPSRRRRQWQEQTLAEFSRTTKWAATFADLAVPDVRIVKPAGSAEAQPNRIFFCNELLDAMPLHRLGWDAVRRSWFEWGVGFDRERFVWTRLSKEPKIQSPGSGEGSRMSAAEIDGSLAAFYPLLPQLLDVLPDGFALEICPAAIAWWKQAAGLVDQGKLIAIDYALELEELLIPERTAGTLRAYYQHRLNDDVLARPGEQDITAHVNFTALQRAGESAGLATEALLTQELFLSRIAGRIWKGELSFGEWTPEFSRQFQTLTHPDHLGRAFRVIVQSRKTQRPGL